MLDWLESPELRQRCQAGLNKSEQRHALAQVICTFSSRAASPTADRRRSSSGHQGLNLVIAAIVYWNSTYLADAVQHLRDQGKPILDALLAHTSPLTWEHIGFFRRLPVGPGRRNRRASPAAQSRAGQDGGMITVPGPFTLSVCLHDNRRYDLWSGGIPDVPQAIRDIDRSDFKIVIVDTPPALGHDEVKLLIARSDYVIVPTTQGVVDMKASIAWMTFLGTQKGSS